MPTIDHDKNLVEDSAPFKGTMMVYESNCSDIENHRSVGNSVNKLEDEVEKYSA